jgi:Tol biopolymer transport system component
MTRSPDSSLRTSALFAAVLLISSTVAVFSASALGKTGLFDHGVIAFVSECTYTVSGLFEIDVAHQIRHQLSDQYDRIFSLSYSPLGSWLVFEAMERNSQGFFSRRVYAIDLDTQSEYLLAPEYVSFNGTPLNWQSDGKHLELRMMAMTTIGMEDIVVNVANGEVVETVPVADSPTSINGADEGGASGVVTMSLPASNAPGAMNNTVDVHISPDGEVVRSRMENGIFDLYVQSAPDAEAVQVTHDNCIERYPRWRPDQFKTF